MRARARQVVPAFLGVALLVGTAACGDDDDSAGPEIGADVEDVAEDNAVADVGAEEGVADGEPANQEEGDLAGAAAGFVGQQVTVSATLQEVVSPSAFRIGDNTSLLVLSAPAPDFTGMGFQLDDQMVEEEPVLQVMGTVREFDIAGFEEEFGVDFDDALFGEFEGQHVIVADRVTTLTGQEVTLSGKVDTILSTVAFRLSGVSWDVLVLDAAQAAVSEEDFVQVTGTVRRFDIASLEEELGTELDDALYEDFEGDLVLVADNVQPAEAAQPAPEG